MRVRGSWAVEKFPNLLRGNRNSEELIKSSSSHTAVSGTVGVFRGAGKEQRPNPEAREGKSAAFK